MTARPSPEVPACRPEDGCITCGDEAHPLQVVAVDEATGLAVAIDEAGLPEEVEVALVGPVAPGDSVLVHAGVALRRLEAVAT